ncbi:NAD-dependent epimerase/dehydratase family protein [Yinghuangia soli]|uniref:NAD(P)-dependent oxidoreductase n=1 Tax=Yinghuangia soli TaxID=2908204 RepID=A0AA41Q6E7_9ACTN|nr:NAD(P)-dependent oxidoreductase [Yinghuangia soli]MCF2532121.1 NAD(P)-dependent oxidoreductase [Yinghuangia soli]
MAMTDTKNVLLAGASGVLGRHAAEALTRRGYTVIGLGRGASADVTADLMDRDALLRAVDGLEVDTVVHAATALREAPMKHKDMYATDDLRVEGTKNLMAAAEAVGARRVVAESMVFGYGYLDFHDQVITEDDFFGPTGDPAVERHVEGMRVKEDLMLNTPGIEGIALRFGLFYGAGGTDALVELLKKRKLPAVNDHGRVLPWVDLADAGEAVALAVEGGEPGQAYNIADDTPMGFGAHVRAVAEAFGTPRPMTLPTVLMRPMTYAYRMTRVNMRVSNAKAKTELGWAPTYPDPVSGLSALAGN